MSDDSLFHEDAYDPATMPTSSLSSVKAVWYRRPWFLITAVIVVVVVASVISDLPHPLSRADDVASQRASVKEINSQLGACVYALSEGEGFYRQAYHGPVPSDQAAIIKSYLPQDINECSGASGQSFELVGNIQIDATKAGKHILKMQFDVGTWATIDAYHVLLDIQTFFQSPHDQKNFANLAYYEAQLAKYRLLARQQVNQASAILSASIAYPKLPSLANLPGT